MRCTPTAHEASTRRRNGIINVAALGVLVAIFGSMAMASNAGDESNVAAVDESASVTIDAHDEPQMMAMEAIGPIMETAAP